MSQEIPGLSDDGDFALSFSPFYIDPTPNVKLSPLRADKLSTVTGEAHFFFKHSPA